MTFANKSQFQLPQHCKCSGAGKYSNSIPFNCVHGAKAKSEVSEYFKTH